MPTLPTSTPPDGALASPPVRVPERIDPDHDLTRLPSREIRAQLAARERDIKFHLESLKNEVTTAAGITVGGRPLPEVARENALRNVLVTLGVGLALGLLRGLRKRAGRRPEPDTEVDLARLRLSIALDDAARRVARGSDPDAALRRSLRTVPVMYSDTATAYEAPASTSRKVIDVVATTVAGFAVKVAMDEVTKRLTGHEEVFAAMADAADGDEPDRAL